MLHVYRGGILGYRLLASEVETLEAMPIVLDKLRYSTLTVKIRHGKAVFVCDMCLVDDFEIASLEMNREKWENIFFPTMEQ